MTEGRSAAMPVSYLIVNLARAIGRELRSVRRPGVAGPQVAPLLALRHEAGLSNAELARRCYVAPQSMNEVVIDLEREGFIHRMPDWANRRVLRASLTPAGRRFLREWERAIDELEERLFAGLTARQVAGFSEALERGVENLLTQLPGLSRQK